MLRRIELLTQAPAPGSDERIRLRSPEVGHFTCAVPAGNVLVAGGSAGVLVTLGESIELIVPRDLPGGMARIVSERPERVHAPVGYGDVLYELVPAEAADAAGSAASDASASTTAPTFRAPHSGRFWLRPSPTDEPFVRVGDELTAGTPVGLIEVMKTFTHVAYDPSDAHNAANGLPETTRLAKVLVEDGDEVTEGQPLMEVEGA